MKSQSPLKVICAGMTLLVSTALAGAWWSTQQSTPVGKDAPRSFKVVSRRIVPLHTPARRVLFQPQNSRLILMEDASPNSANIRTWNSFPSGSPKLLQHVKGYISDIAVSPKGTIAFASSQGRIIVLDGKRIKATFPLHLASACRISLSDDNKFLAYYDAGIQQIRVFNLDTKREIANRKFAVHKVMAIRFADESKCIAVSLQTVEGGNSQVEIFSRLSLQLKQTIPLAFPLRMASRSQELAISNMGLTGSLEIQNIKTGKGFSAQLDSKAPNDIVFAPSGRYLAASYHWHWSTDDETNERVFGYTGRIVLWNLKDRRAEEISNSEEEKGRSGTEAMNIGFSADEKQLYLWDYDRIKIWQLEFD